MLPRPGLHIHSIGPRAEIIDDGGHIQDAYALKPGDWVLVRPDGYVGAIVASNEITALETYFQTLGLELSLGGAS